MLSEKEKYGISELLNRMDKKDLCSLAQTVTCRLIVPETNHEAIQAIILHTDSAIDLLKRRKVKKEFLFKYLHAKRIPVEASAEKQAVINHVLTLWESDLPSVASTTSLATLDEESSLPEAPAPSRNTSYTSLCSLDCGTVVNPSGLQLPLNALCSDDPLRRTESNVSMMVMDDPENSNSALFGVGGGGDGIEISTSSSTAVDSLNFVGSVQSFSQQQAQEMADKFVKWFYELLNSTSHSDQTDFGPQHFWVDASAKISLQSDSGNAMLSDAEFFHVRDNGDEVCTTLGNIVRKYKLTYNPNLCSEGVRGHIDPHGLVVVTACGTLHNTNTCCGIFHQRFGLIRDPASGNSWKIKFTEANLVSKAVHEVPRLTNINDLCAMALS